MEDPIEATRLLPGSLLSWSRFGETDLVKKPVVTGDDICTKANEDPAQPVVSHTVSNERRHWHMAKEIPHDQYY